MSDPSNGDPIKFLFKLHRKITYAMDAEKHGHVGLAAVARGVVLMFGLGVAGPTLWAALDAMPAAVVFLIVLGLTVRLALYAWKRFR
jgi:hypothetical protein